MAFPEKKEVARNLRRKEHLSITEIAERLGVAKSTVYYWTRDIIIPPLHQNVDCSVATRAMQEMYRQKREDARHDGYGWAEKNLSPKIAYAIGLWEAEGASHHTELNISNCDVSVLVAFKDLLVAIGVPESKFRVMVHIHDEKQKESAETFWKSETGVDDILFYVKGDNGNKERKWPYGVGYLEVIGGGQTYWHCFLDGILKYIKTL